MKKKILIVMKRPAGGVGKSCISLLSQLDYNKYDVDLQLFRHEGIFLDMIPKNVNILESPQILQDFWRSGSDFIQQFLKKGQFGHIGRKVMASIESKLYRDRYHSALWENFKQYIPNINKHYDVAIGYMDTYPNYFVADKVSADIKIGWNHNDFRMLNLDKEYEKEVFSKFKYVITVSETCKQVLVDLFPDFSEKFKVIYNIVSPEQIWHMANKEEGFEDKDFDGIRIVSVGSLTHQKGFDMAIPAFSRLLEKGHNVKWYVIGEGALRKELEKLIKEYDVEGKFILLGERVNPYPYIKNADIYAQPSRFEGKSIAVDEAKILCKPILLTDYTTAENQIKNGVNGIIVPKNIEGIYEGLELLIKDSMLRKRFSENLQKENLGNESEVEKLYKLIEE
ncbi:acetylgalactosaminyltransferase [Parageobacillus caldoxylosilyticus]|uniref:glycosyltransferase n=1 Tax=Saccharococcus caldoxylosilyticus TaxID=81408 RepID=UPI001C4E0722|nr:glycosyltransferase [Parageobacillus caldoxylosilyticus]QXJ38649.1 acetylgalactosaminyltransferase [Parageobacillus caldoxylosilyticus]